MQNGTVKKIVMDKGFGFISTSDGQELMNIWGEMDRGAIKKDDAFEEADKAVRNRQGVAEP